MVLILGLVSTFYFFGLVINTTYSLPKGIYQKISATPKKGDIVLACVNNQEAYERGYFHTGFYCSTGIMPIMKYWLAGEGDIIEVTPQGVKINEVLVANTIPLIKDVKGRAMHFNIPLNTPLKLDKNQAYLLSNYTPYSFDGRYFGVIKTDQITSTLQPLYTWGD